MMRKRGTLGLHWFIAIAIGHLMRHRPIARAHLHLSRARSKIKKNISLTV